MGETRSDPDKTELAEDRTVLANERTYAGWMRTSMACVAVALGLRALVRDFEPAWIPKLAGSLLILAGVALVILAWRRSRHVLSRLSTHTIKSMPGTPMGLISVTIICAYVMLGAILWFVL